MAWTKWGKIKELTAEIQQISNQIYNNNSEANDCFRKDAYVRQKSLEDSIRNLKSSMQRKQDELTKLRGY